MHLLHDHSFMNFFLLPLLSFVSFSSTSSRRSSHFSPRLRPSACRLRLPAGNCRYHKADQRTAVKHLPEKCHRKNRRSIVCNHTGINSASGLLEDQRRPEAHDRTHESHRHRRSEPSSTEDRPVHSRCHHAKSDLRSQTVDHEKAHHKQTGNITAISRNAVRNPAFVSPLSRSPVLYSSMRQHHEKRHQHAVSGFLKFCLRHRKKPSFPKTPHPFPDSPFRRSAPDPGPEILSAASGFLRIPAIRKGVNLFS